MYKEGSNAYRYHVQKYGHPSKFGFKDVIRRWQAAQWDPDALLALYRKAGARHFVALANHHDNFDLYDSRFQPEWNSTRIGPKKDMIAGWAKAARAQGPAGREIAIAAMGAAQGYLKKPVAMVECVGTGQALAFRQEAAGLRVPLPSAPPALPYAFALKVLT
jgi:hypothetical protein